MLPSSDSSPSSSASGAPPKPAAAGLLPQPELPCLPRRSDSATDSCAFISMSNRSTFLVLLSALAGSVWYPKALSATAMSAFFGAGVASHIGGITVGVSCSGWAPTDCPLHGSALEQLLQHLVRDSPLNDDLQAQPAVAHLTK